MKTTKRVIRLQHGLQNSCDVPKPVQGLTKTGVYSEEVPDSASPAFANFYSRLQRGNAFPPVEPFFHSQQLQTFLHTTIEVFPDVLDTGELISHLLNHSHCHQDNQPHLQASCCESASCWRIPWLQQRSALVTKKSSRRSTSAFKPSSRQSSRAAPMGRAPATRSSTASSSTAANHQHQLKN